MPPRIESDRAKRLIAEHLQRIGVAKGRQARAAAFDLMAADLATMSDAPNVLRRFLEGDTNAVRFALELCSRLPPPLPSAILPLLIEQLAKTRFPTPLRITVAGNVVRSVPADSPHLAGVLAALERKASPHRAATRLLRLEQLVPPLAVLTRRRKELEREALARCPQCGVQLPQAEFARHVWEQHQLLYERGRVLEPWRAIEEWVRDYAKHGPQDLLDRSCDFAQTLDPEGGLTRIHQLLMSTGAADEEAHTLLRAEAATKNAALCPHCFTLVPLEATATPSDVIVGPTRIEGHGYRIEFGPGSVQTELFIATPLHVVFDGPEPGHAFTHRGAVMLLLGPLILLASLFAALPAIKNIPPLAPVLAILTATLGIYIGMRFYRRHERPPLDRIVDHAWTILVPRLLINHFDADDAEFIAGLANASLGYGDPDARTDEMARVAKEMLRDRAGQTLITPLHALLISDVRDAGGDDVLPIADRIGEGFTGPMTLDHIENLIQRVRGDTTDRTRRARLRVLILAKGFQADLEADDLRRIGRVCPGLGATYASEDRDGLTRLRLLWLYRPKRLWQRIGSATTVFDLARYPTLAQQYLKQRPDLLLFQASSDDAAPILICEEGVVYRDSVITSRDEAIYVRATSVVLGGGYDLFIGPTKYWFRNDPIVLAQRLKGWAEFLFDEFLPRSRMLYQRRSPRGERLLKQKRMTCTVCRQDFFGVRGDVGLRVTGEAG